MGTVDMRILKTGDEVSLGVDQMSGSDQPVVVIVGESYGYADLRVVGSKDGRSGLIAFKRDGSWWWVRELEYPEPEKPNA